MESFEDDKNYKIRLMPNIYNFEKNVITIKCINATTNSRIPIKKHFCYMLVNDKIGVYNLPIKIYGFINLFLNGDVSINSDDYLIGDSKVQQYYLNGISGEIGTFLHSEDSNYDYKKDIKHITESINLMDIKAGYEIEFDIKRKMGFLLISHLKFKKNEPLYKEGDDKNKILKMYNGVPNIEEEVEIYMNNSKSNNPNILFNLEADLYIKNLK